MVNKEEFFYQSCAEKVRRGNSTPFLDPRELAQIKSRLKGENYLEFKPFDGAACAILYQEELPITCLKLNSFQGTHQDLVGTFYHHNLDRHVWGDIIVGESTYVLVLNTVLDYFLNYIDQIGSSKVKWEVDDIHSMNAHVPSFQPLSIIVPSLRADLVLAKLLSKSRSQVLDILKNGDFILNYGFQKKPSTILKEGDIFSVRHYGKYQFLKIEGHTKKESLILNLHKY